MYLKYREEINKCINETDSSDTLIEDDSIIYYEDDSLDPITDKEDLNIEKKNWLNKKNK